MSSSGRIAGLFGLVGVVAVGGLGGAACSAFGDNSEGSAPPPASSAGDAGDTSTDAGVDGSAAGRGCASPHAFCDDFDTEALGVRWSSAVSGGAATLVLDAADAVSKPRSLLATLAPYDAGSIVSAYLEKSFDAASGLTCTWKMRAEQLPTLGEPDLLEVYVTSPNQAAADTNFSVSVASDRTKLNAFQGTTFAEYPGAAALPTTGTWLDGTMVLSPDGKVTVLIGDRLMQTTFPSNPFPATQIKVRVGLAFVDKSDGARVRYDDFACDRTP